MGEVSISGTTRYLDINGYLYIRHSPGNGVVYYRCKRKDECPARAIILGDYNITGAVVVRKGPDKSEHVGHAPDREEIEALKIVGGLKRQAIEHPETAPIQIVRKIQNVSEGVLSRLPDRDNLRKALQRQRMKGLPANPRKIEDLLEIPETYRFTGASQPFLLYDSFEDENDCDSSGRVIIFSTHENLRLLMTSEMWFVDGTFKTSPEIFTQVYWSTQVFAILGFVTQIVNDKEQIFALPYVYALLQNKEEASYSKVFEIIIQKASTFGFTMDLTNIKVMTDFELAVINSIKLHVGEDSVQACFFHMRQSIFRRIQAEGLQELYNDENDRSLRNECHMMCALAFVPTENVSAYFDIFDESVSETFMTIATYFEQTYIKGLQARGRRRATLPKYPPKVWNQYESVLQKRHRTNNLSEGGHNRFQIVVGRNHPSLYNFLLEMIKEQGETEVMIAQLNLGQKVKKARPSSRQKVEDRLYNVVVKYQESTESENVLKYLRVVGHNIIL